MNWKSNDSQIFTKPLSKSFSVDSYICYRKCCILDSKSITTLDNKPKMRRKKTSHKKHTQTHSEQKKTSKSYLHFIGNRKGGVICLFSLLSHFGKDEVRHNNVNTSFALSHTHTHMSIFQCVFRFWFSISVQSHSHSY